MKKLICILSLAGIIILVGAGCGTSTTQPSTPPALSIGEEGIVNNNSDRNDTSGISILAVDEKAFDDFTQALIADDTLGYSQMLGEGRLFVVDNGTAVKVIDIAFGKTRVRILEGEYLGESGWIASEFVVSK